MTGLKFTSVGKVPRLLRMEAYVFHDAQGAIRHVHQHIVLEGARPRPVEVMLEEVRAHAASYGNDVSKLKLLHVKHALDPGLQYRVDVKRGALVARPLPSRPAAKRVVRARKLRAAPARARKKR